MKEYKKLLPALTPDSKTYWEGCKRHELLIQRCKECGKYRFEPRIICPNCTSMDTEWTKAGGKGKVWSFGVCHQLYDPAWKEDIPYVIGVIELEEGVKMVSNIIDCKPEDVKIGMKVEVIFEDVTEEITLPKFRLVS